MTRRRNAMQTADLATERFDLRPIEPIGFSRKTFDWTKDRQTFADLSWRTTDWTKWRWWRHLRKFARKDGMCHGIWPRGAADPIGLHIASFSKGSNTVNIGVLVGDRAWWGKGVVIEVRSAVLAECFGRLDVRRAMGIVNARNFASVYNYQRLGFTNEGTMREHAVLLDGSHSDQLIFGLMRSEWLALHPGDAGGREDRS